MLFEKRKLLTSAPQQRKISLNKVSWRKRLTAGLVDLDTFILSVRFSTRVEGSYVLFKFFATKDNSLFTLKLRLSTFRALAKRIRNLSQQVERDAYADGKN